MLRRRGAPGQLVGSRLDDLLNRDDQTPVAIHDLTRVDDLQPNNPLAARSGASDVPLRRLLAIAEVPRTDV
jgi:hypothetical protein